MKIKIVYYTVLVVLFILLFSCAIAVMMWLNLSNGGLWRYFIIITCFGIFFACKSFVKLNFFKNETHNTNE